MVPVADASPVLIGNKVESIVPYHMSDEFVVNAKENGTVVERTEDFVVVKYASGKNYAIDIGNRVRKNSSGGFYIQNNLTCDLKVGQKFKKGDILAYNETSFAKNSQDRGVSMKLGVLAKVAIMSNWDLYEDSAPITASLAKRLATTMIWKKDLDLKPFTRIDYMVKIGDKVSAGDPLMRFIQTEDDEIDKFLGAMREDLKEDIIEDTKTAPTSKYTGEVADIRIYTTVPLEDLSPSLRKIVEEYHKRIKRKTDVLNRYANDDDYAYYKAGQVISETPEVVSVGSKGKIFGSYAEGKVLIEIYVRYEDIAAKGDKICHEFALKGTDSHVIEEGFEPYSEYRPDEEISSMIAPLAVAARKTPSVFIAMFGNKLLIELKRHLEEMYLKGSGSIADRRKKFMNYLCKCMDLLDPTKQNSKDYKDQFKGMADSQFDTWCKKFFKDEKANWYLEIVEYERDLTIENIEACAEFMKVPLFEYVAVPYLTMDPNNVMVSPEPVPVGYLHEKRMPQTVLKKSAGTIKIQKRNPKTGQVTGEDKVARNSDTETYSMIAYGAEKSLKELMGPRADDMRAKNQMYNAIARKGYVSLDELEDDPLNKVSLCTFDAYFAYQGLLTNLITPLDRVSTYPK